MNRSSHRHGGQGGPLRRVSDSPRQTSTSRRNNVRASTRDETRQITDSLELTRSRRMRARGRRGSPVSPHDVVLTSPHALPPADEIAVWQQQRQDVAKRHTEAVATLITDSNAGEEPIHGQQSAAGQASAHAFAPRRTTGLSASVHVRSSASSTSELTAAQPTAPPTVCLPPSSAVHRVPMLLPVRASTASEPHDAHHLEDGILWLSGELVGSLHECDTMSFPSFPSASTTTRQRRSGAPVAPTTSPLWSRPPSSTRHVDACAWVDSLSGPVTPRAAHLAAWSSSPWPSADSPTSLCSCDTPSSPDCHGSRSSHKSSPRGASQSPAECQYASAYTQRRQIISIGSRGALQPLALSPIRPREAGADTPLWGSSLDFSDIDSDANESPVLRDRTMARDEVDMSTTESSERRRETLTPYRAHSWTGHPAPWHTHGFVDVPPRAARHRSGTEEFCPGQALFSRAATPRLPRPTSGADSTDFMTGSLPVTERNANSSSAVARFHPFALRRESPLHLTPLPFSTAGSSAEVSEVRSSGSREAVHTRGAARLQAEPSEDGLNEREHCG